MTGISLCCPTIMKRLKEVQKGREEVYDRIKTSFALGRISKEEYCFLTGEEDDGKE